MLGNLLAVSGLDLQPASRVQVPDQVRLSCNTVVPAILDDRVTDATIAVDPDVVVKTSDGVKVFSGLPLALHRFRFVQDVA